MNPLIDCLEDVQVAETWLAQQGIRDCGRGHTNLRNLAGRITSDLLALLLDGLETHLRNSSDPDRALNNLDRFFERCPNPSSLASQIEREPGLLPPLLQIFSSSQYLAEVLIRDSETLRVLSESSPPATTRAQMVEELVSRVDTANDEATVMEALRLFKRRETLRIAVGDIVKQQPLALVTDQVSTLADVVVEAGLRAAWRFEVEKRGTPLRSDGGIAGIAALALGKLGGRELNYSSDIDLMFIAETNGKTDARRATSNQEFFERLVKRLIRMISEPTDLGFTYRVDVRLRPTGRSGVLVSSVESALRYYDVSGRTWERQAFVKARVIAGNQQLGERFLVQMESWVYRRYLNRADITGIKALKRRIERRSMSEGHDRRNVKMAHGGIRNIEFVIQFLQLLNGGELPEIRTGNTLMAIEQLAKVKCLTSHESDALQSAYRFLRQVEHRLQMMFDLQTHSLPEDPEQVALLARRLGYSDDDTGSARDKFRRELSTIINHNQEVLNRVLQDAFLTEDVEPEVDLVLDPAPDHEQIQALLQRYRFVDTLRAYKCLSELAQEKISFLSSRRCRHFLSTIAPPLLRQIGNTPDPDSTLLQLSHVSDSLGCKGVLWELFSTNPPSLNLYVKLCASAPYLSNILTSNPGMIDELMDSLLLEQLPTKQGMEQQLDELLRYVQDPLEILHSFKNSHHLRVGVRDILGREDIRSCHRALADIAEVCICKVAELELKKLIERHGTPRLGEDHPRAGDECSLVIVSIGKLGGREPNYHSDMDVVFLYEGEGTTDGVASRSTKRRPEATTNQHFFSQLSQRIMKVINHLGPHGRLYELDSRLRPAGRSGPLAISLAELDRYFSTVGQLWERQAFCKSRIIFASDSATADTELALRQAITTKEWRPEFAQEIRDMRDRLEATASPKNLKRGPGGTMDIEFIVQMLQLKYVADQPELLVPGTLDAILLLQRAGCLEPDDADHLHRGYRLLRSVEAGLRLMNTTARHDIPNGGPELRRLAFLLGETPAFLARECSETAKKNRQIMDRIFAQHGAQ